MNLREFVIKVFFLCVCTGSKSEYIDLRCAVKNLFSTSIMPSFSMNITALITPENDIMKIKVVPNGNHKDYGSDVIDVMANKTLITYSRTGLIDVEVVIPMEFDYSGNPEFHKLTLTSNSEGYSIYDDTQSEWIIGERSTNQSDIVASKIIISKGTFTTECESANRLWLINNIESTLCCFSEEGIMDLLLFSWKEFRPTFWIEEIMFSLSWKNGMLIIDYMESDARHLPANIYQRIKLIIDEKGLLKVSINGNLTSVGNLTVRNPIINMTNYNAETFTVIHRNSIDENVSEEPVRIETTSYDCSHHLIWEIILTGLFVTSLAVTLYFAITGCLRKKKLNNKCEASFVLRETPGRNDGNILSEHIYDSLDLEAEAACMRLRGNGEHGKQNKKPTMSEHTYANKYWKEEDAGLSSNEETACYLDPKPLAAGLLPCKPLPQPPNISPQELVLNLPALEI